jgi:hypothetical protein
MPGPTALDKPWLGVGRKRLNAPESLRFFVCHLLGKGSGLRRTQGAVVAADKRKRKEEKAGCSHNPVTDPFIVGCFRTAASVNK